MASDDFIDSAWSQEPAQGANRPITAQPWFWFIVGVVILALTVAPIVWIFAGDALALRFLELGASIR